MTWKPIDTAPKDGTCILGYADDETTVVYWFHVGRNWELSVSGAYCDDGEWTPTHWMPLPSPPGVAPTDNGDCTTCRHMRGDQKRCMTCFHEAYYENWEPIQGGDE